MNEIVKNLASDLFWNLRNGLKLLLFRPMASQEFRVGLNQAVMLIVFYAFVTFVRSLMSSFPNPEFSITGIANIATQISLILLFVYIISSSSKIKFEVFFIVMLSMWPWLYILWVVIGGGENFSTWAFYGKDKELYFIYNLYFIAVVCTALFRLFDANIKVFFKNLAAFLVVVFVPLHFIYVGQFWHVAYDYEKEMEKYAKINQEDLYYKQFGLIEELKHTLLPSRSDLTDLYFVGFGSYASEDVFMKEINYAKDLFDRRFDTEGRSVALINNYQTVDNVPLASRNNLGLVLNHIGNIIDRQDDVVFLYLTSHGSKKHKLSVELTPLRLNTIGPGDLKSLLDKAEIKWRVLLVSACYSGGFVEPLKDNYTVIMTAAAPDKQSFGCGSKSEFTYFGKAIFQEQLSKHFNFIKAFDNALVSIQRREKNEKREPSLPVLYIGDKIRPKLRYLGQDLEKYYSQQAKLDS